MLAVPIYMLQLFARVLTSGSMSTLLVLTLGAFIALIFFFFFDAVRQRLISRLATRLEASLGPTVLNVLVSSVSASERRGGQPIRDLHEIRRFITSAAFTALLDAPWSLMFLALIFVFHPLLGVVATIGILLLLALSIISEMGGRDPDARALEAHRTSNEVADEMLRNADSISAMGKMPGQIERWKQSAFVSMIEGTVAVDRTGLVASFAKFLRLALQIIILAVGVTLVLNGSISPGVMIAVSILLGRAAAPVEMAIAGWRPLLEARAAVRRLNLLLGAIADGDRPMALPEPEGRVSVESATVVVPERQDPVLFGVDFVLKPGDSLGLIGPSGAGKTTLARALVGLQPLSRGYIRIDDAALTDWPKDQIGKHVGFLPQRVELFDGTIAENIAMMDPDASPTAIVEAAKRAEVHNLILTMPGGYNAPVGVRGDLMSAGQRQRIGLARAFYGEKKLIVLDEPNANLDPEGEHALAAAIQNATSRGTVVVIITHRMGILRQLSYAALMQNGRIVRYGAAREIIEATAQPMSAEQAAESDRVTVLRGRTAGSANPA